MNQSTTSLLAPLAELHRQELLADTARAPLVAEARRGHAARPLLATVVAALRRWRFGRPGVRLATDPGAAAQVSAAARSDPMGTTG